jgi:signal transduction histidine kinase
MRYKSVQIGTIGKNRTEYMTIQARMKSRRLIGGITLFILVLSILVIAFVNALAFTKYPFAGFFFQPNLYVSFTERAQWEGMKNGIKPLYRLEKINNVQITNGTQALKTVQRMPEGSKVLFTFKTEEGIKDVTINLSRFTLNDFSVTFLLPFLIGLFFLVTGFVVNLLNPFKKIAFIYYVSSLFVALFYSTVLDSNTTYWFYRLFALYPLFGAASVHLIISITASDFLKKHPFTEAVPYILASIIVLFQQYYLYSSSSASLIYLASPMFLVGCLLLNFVYLIIYYITTKNISARRKTRFYLIGLFFGTVIPVLWAITFAFGKPLLSLDWAIALSIFYPIFTGYAVTREDLFNLESIVRTSLEYLVFTGVILASYFIIVAVTSLAVQKYVQSTPFIHTIITIFVVVTLLPFKNKIQKLIDKTFYPERYNTADTLNDVTTSLAYVRERKTLGVVLGRKISNAISLKSAGLLYPSKDGKTVYYSSHRGFISMEMSRHALQRIFPKPGTIEYINDIAETVPPRAKRTEVSDFKSLSAQYFLPIGRDKTRGVLLIGEKIDEDTRFIHDDFQFLKSLYPQIEIALVNAELHEQKADQEKFAAIGEVASVIVHEIKNPLGIIKVSSNTLRKRLPEDPKSSEILGFIEEEVDRMNDTVTSFLDFARPKHPIKKLYSVEEFSAYLMNVKPQIEKDGHKMEMTISDDVKSFNVDPDHLKQMLLNLLINAQEASPTGGTIKVHTFIDEEGTHIKVTDSGKGISEDVGQKIFDPFFTTREHGTGLGLSVTKQLARSNGGDVRWKNSPEGGAAFMISFPREDAVNEL